MEKYEYLNVPETPLDDQENMEELQLVNARIEKVSD